MARKRKPHEGGIGPEFRAWWLDAEGTSYAVQYLKTGDLYVVDHQTMVGMIKRANRWTLNQDG